MSMLNTQCDELRKMAAAYEKRGSAIGLEYGMGLGLVEAARMMREAAGTIEVLSANMEFYIQDDAASIQIGKNVYRRVSIPIDDFNAACDHYGFVKERTCHVEWQDELPYLVCSNCGAIQPEDHTVYFCWSCGAKVVSE